MRDASVLLAALAATVALVGAGSAHAKGARVGLLGATGTAPAAELAALDRALDRDVRAAADHQVLSAATLASEIEGARALGLQCSFDDTECIVKLGILLKLDRVVTARLADDQLTLTLVDVAQQGVARRAEAPVPERGRASAVAHDLVTQLFADAPASPPTRVEPAGDGDRARGGAPDGAQAPPGSALAIAGLWMLGVGAAAGVGLGGATLAADVALTGDFDQGARSAIWSAEWAFAVGAGVAVLTAIGGVVALAVGSSQSP